MYYVYVYTCCLYKYAGVNNTHLRWQCLFYCSGAAAFYTLIFFYAKQVCLRTHKLSFKCFQFINVLYLPYSVKFLMYSIPVGKVQGTCEVCAIHVLRFFCFSSILNSSDSNLDTFLLSYSIPLLMWIMFGTHLSVHVITSLTHHSNVITVLTCAGPYP